LEPFDRDIVRVERGVLDPGWLPVPVDALGLLRPEAVRVLDRALVHRAVVAVPHVGAPEPIGRNFIKLVRHRSVLLLARASVSGARRPSDQTIIRHYAPALGRATRPRDIVLSLRLGHGLVTNRDERYKLAMGPWQDLMIGMQDFEEVSMSKRSTSFVAAIL